jgi:hypothetical protein
LNMLRGWPVSHIAQQLRSAKRGNIPKVRVYLDGTNEKGGASHFQALIPIDTNEQLS